MLQSTRVTESINVIIDDDIHDIVNTYHIEFPIDESDKVHQDAKLEFMKNYQA